MSGGRSLDSVWEHFIRKRSDELASTSNSKCNKAICKYCKKDIVALVARMKQHLNKCQLRTDKDDTVNLNESENSENVHITTVASELDQLLNGATQTLTFLFARLANKIKKSSIFKLRNSYFQPILLSIP